jgi:hypothetical protein
MISRPVKVKTEKAGKKEKKQEGNEKRTEGGS